MSTSHSRERSRRLVEQAIAQCLELTHVLKACLADEREALERRDREALEQALTSKRECVFRIGQVDLPDELAGHGGSGVGEEGRDVEACLASLGDDGSLRSRWQALLATTHECRELNELNGRLASGLRERAGQTLLLLRGSSNNVGIYGPDGALDVLRLTS